MESKVPAIRAAFARKSSQGGMHLSTLSASSLADQTVLTSSDDNHPFFGLLKGPPQNHLTSCLRSSICCWIVVGPICLLTASL